MKPKILLHTCCAPCASVAIVRLLPEFNPVLLFYNPNIHPEKEYIQRREETKRLADFWNLKFIEGPYYDKTWGFWKWFALASPLKNEPEGGKRCKVCFGLRLRYTAMKASYMGIKYFTTTLTTGPNKPASIINVIGKRWAQAYGLIFIEADFKKKNGYLASVRMSKQLNLYRQHYCGCIYSFRDSFRK